MQPKASTLIEGSAQFKLVSVGSLNAAYIISIVQKTSRWRHIFHILNCRAWNSVSYASTQVFTIAQCKIFFFSSGKINLTNLGTSVKYNRKSLALLRQEVIELSEQKFSYLKLIYSENATKFCEIFTLLLTGTTQDKSK